VLTETPRLPRDAFAAWARGFIPHQHGSKMNAAPLRRITQSTKIYFLYSGEKDE
jgi:hypothetical protein